MVVEDNQNNRDFKLQQRNHKGGAWLPIMALKTNSSMWYYSRTHKLVYTICHTINKNFEPSE
jgi:hypothetical protein